MMGTLAIKGLSINISIKVDKYFLKGEKQNITYSRVPNKRPPLIFFKNFSDFSIFLLSNYQLEVEK